MKYLYPYKLGSASGRALAQTLKIKRVLGNGRFNPRRKDQVINWGNTQLPSVWEWNERKDLNHPNAVTSACNKLLAFQSFDSANVPTPNFTTSKELAQEWISAGSIIVARATLTGHSGRGITLHGREFTEPLPTVPLYTEYKKKRAEFRVHVFKGVVIDTVQKKKRNANERPSTFNTFIRNHTNGWVYCRDGITPDINRDSIAIRAISALSLDFGAVDIIYNEHENQYYVLEVNTAPGIENTTLNKYVECIARL